MKYCNPLNEVCRQAYNPLFNHNLTNVKVFVVRFLTVLFVFCREITVAAMTNGYFKMLLSGMHKHGHSTRACGQKLERFKGEFKKNTLSF